MMKNLKKGKYDNVLAPRTDVFLLIVYDIRAEGDWPEE